MKHIATMIAVVAALMVGSCGSKELQGKWQSERIIDNDGQSSRVETLIWEIDGSKFTETRMVNIEGDQGSDHVAIIGESTVKGKYSFDGQTLKLTYDPESLESNVDVISTLAGEDESKIRATLLHAQKKYYEDSKKTPVSHTDARIEGDTLFLNYQGHQGTRFLHHPEE